MQKPEFIEFNTKDGLTLPGLFYRAEKSKKAVICLHGNGSSSVFYNEPENRILADALQKQNVSVLFFNNRGANIIKKLNIKNGNEVERRRFGMAYEKIKECVEDIEGAVSFLEKLGYKEFYLAGTSTGANKICVYNFYKPQNKISRYVLYCGGDDTGLYYKALGGVKFKNILYKAKEKIKAGKGEEISSELLPFDLVFSYSSFYDIANPDGDYNVFPYYEAINKIKLSNKPPFRYFKSINKPTLVVYGELDEYTWGDGNRAADILKNYQPDFDYKVIKGADHRFSGHEKELAKITTDWLVK